MTVAETELEQMLRDARRLNAGPAKWTALDSVFRHADAAGLTEFGYRARMGSLDELWQGGELTRSFLAFTHCLSVFDNHPDLVRPGDEHHLLWEFKAVAAGLPSFPEVPLDRARRLLDEMERRYLAGGHSLHAVYQRRAVVAHHLGELDEAAEWFDRMATAKRDGLSDCAGCVPNRVIIFLADRDDHEEAVRLGAPLSDKQTCGAQPHLIQGNLLLPYLRTGRFAEAVAAHRSAYPKLREHRIRLAHVGLHLQFCGLTGNTDRGLTLLDHHLPWLDRPSSPADAMSFAIGAVIVLRRLIEAGRDAHQVRRRTDNGDRQWASTVRELHDEMLALARRHAAAFDKRNGNTYQSSTLEARIDADPVTGSLPLTVFTGRPIAEHPGRAEVDALIRAIADRTAARDHAGAARLRLEVARRLHAGRQWDDATESAEEAVRSLDRVGLTAEAMAARWLLVELHQRGHRHREEVRALLEELLAAPHRPEPVPSRAVLLERLADDPGPGRDRVGLLLEAADLHREAGDTAAETRLVLNALSWVTEVPADAAALVSRVDALVGEEVPPSVRAELCRLEGGLGLREQALERARRDPGDDGALRTREAFLLLELGRAAEAEVMARPWADDDDGEWFWEACVIVVRSLQARGREADALAFLAGHDLDLSDMEDVYLD
ncbi:hypothetical protein Q0Z83_106700 [Actinoplanes sichuanensis]|uniref:Tetratricopeptide repeat protein n=1 Tax=Actinoplanes sichuanensis TaxID=512349 RepID=A0ABW4AM44_9ACTN|nr:hypothetical protein [Actinoplanes sichuanensis]BEL12479.1 hypothetical protein Q0Z83_106700 [Actinoplanes sichuanensis]